MSYKIELIYAVTELLLVVFLTYKLLK